MAARAVSPTREKKAFHPPKKILKGNQLRADGLMKEFLGQVTRAAYQVALKTGFRGSFIHFLEEVQEALSSVIRQDEKRDTLSH